MEKDTGPQPSITSPDAVADTAMDIFESAKIIAEAARKFQDGDPSNDRPAARSIARESLSIAKDVLLLAGAAALLWTSVIAPAFGG